MRVMNVVLMMAMGTMWSAHADAVSTHVPATQHIEGIKRVLDTPAAALMETAGYAGVGPTATSDDFRDFKMQSGKMQSGGAALAPGEPSPIRLAMANDLRSPRGEYNSPVRPDATSMDAEQPLPSAWLVTFILVALIGQQLRRKHRFLRPQRFTQY